MDYSIYDAHGGAEARPRRGSGPQNMSWERGPDANSDHSVHKSESGDPRASVSGWPAQQLLRFSLFLSLSTLG